MNQHLHIQRHTGESTVLSLKLLDATYLDQILHLQEEIIADLPDSSWYVPTTLAEFNDYLSGLGTLLGYVTQDDELAALGIYAHYKDPAHNYGSDLELPQEQLAFVGQIDCTIVKKSFRGNKLQQHLCYAIESIAQKEGMSLLSATVSPDNIYSLSTFIDIGYTIRCEKLKYGGLRRYVLAKELS